MALAIPASVVRDTTTSRSVAATWTGISAGIALLATVPLVWLLANPISDLVYVRGSSSNSSWGYVFAIALILTAPATYALFFGTTGELLKPRVPPAVHKTTMRIAALGLLPYLTMATLAVYWESGPRDSLLIAAGLTIPIAMAATVWASTQNH